MNPAKSGVGADFSQEDAPDAEIFRATFEQAAVGMAHVALDGRFCRVNARLCAMLGYTRDELLRRTFQEITHDEDLPGDLKLAARLLAGEIAHYRLEKRYRRQDGTPFWIALTVSLARRADGTPDCFVKVVEDINDRHLAEEGRNKALRLYQTLLETSQILAGGLAREALLRRVCEVAVEHGGFRLAWVGLIDDADDGVRVAASAAASAGAAEYLSGIAVSARADRPEGRGPTGRAIREGERQVVNDLFAAGNTRPWHQRARAAGLRASAALPLREGERVIGALNVYAGEIDFFDHDVVRLLDEMARDIGFALDHLELDAARRQAEAALAARERQLRALFEQAPDGVLVADRDWRLLDANDAVCALLGRPRAALLGLSLDELIDEATPAELRAALRGLAVGRTFSGEGYLRGGEAEPILVDLVARRLDDGRVQCLARDIGERRRLERLDRGSALILEALVRGDALPQVLGELVGYVERLLPGAIGSVLLLDREARHLYTGAAPGMPAAFNRAIDGAAIGPAEGSCGTAAYQGRRVVVEDIDASPLWRDYRELARLGGVRACWSEPILADGRALGTFALYYRTPRTPNAGQLAVLERAAHFAALAIARARLEDDLRTALARRRQLFDDAPIGLALCRMDGALVEVNPAFARMIGREVEETLRLTYWQITPDGYAEAEREQLRQIAERGAYGPYEKEYRHADGHRVPVRLRGRSIVVDGEPMIWSAIEDLSEQRLAEENRRALAERISALIERMSDGFVMLDRAWNYVYVNRRAGELLGRPPEALVGRHIWTLFPEGVGQPFHQAYVKAMDEHTTITLEEFYEPWRRWFENRIHGDVDGISIYFQDITERKLAERALREANERLQALSGKLLGAQEAERRRLSQDLHDQIGQALTALKITLQSAARQAPGDALRRRLEHGAEIADGALAEVRTLSLDLRPPQLDDLGLAAALRWNLERQAAIAGFSPRFVDHGCPRRLPEALAIAAYRIAQEAVTNALRHARAGEVSIELSLADGGLRLCIADDGDGFDAPGAAAASGRPVSLGLAGMAERAALVGGRLTIDSAPGRGTAITAHLPLPAIETGERP